MKIAILNDQTVDSWMGGAALVNQRIQEALEDKGHKVTLVIKNPKRQDPIPDADVYVLANVPYFTEQDFNKVMQKSYIIIRHDIPVVLYMKPKSEKYLPFFNLYQKLFDNASMNVFISPMQKEVFQTRFKLNDYNTHICPPPLNLSGFNEPKDKPESGCLYLGDISSARGCAETMQLMKQVDDGPYTFVGQILEPELKQHLQNEGAIVIDAVPHEKIPEVMNMHKNFFYYPNIYDSFCLKIVEAELMGMTMFTDKLCIGRYSYKKTAEELKQDIETNSLKTIVDFIENAERRNT